MARAHGRPHHATAGGRTPRLSSAGGPAPVVAPDTTSVRRLERLEECDQVASPRSRSRRRPAPVAARRARKPGARPARPPAPASPRSGWSPTPAPGRAPSTTERWPRHRPRPGRARSRPGTPRAGEQHAVCGEPRGGEAGRLVERSSGGFGTRLRRGTATRSANVPGWRSDSSERLGSSVSSPHQPGRRSRHAPRPRCRPRRPRRRRSRGSSAAARRAGPTPRSDQRSWWLSEVAFTATLVQPAATPGGDVPPTPVPRLGRPCRCARRRRQTRGRHAIHSPRDRRPGTRRRRFRATLTRWSAQAVAAAGVHLRHRRTVRPTFAARSSGSDFLGLRGVGRGSAWRCRPPPCTAGSLAGWRDTGRAMSQENLQRVREQYARYNAGERVPGAVLARGCRVRRRKRGGGLRRLSWDRCDRQASVSGRQLDLDLKTRYSAGRGAGRQGLSFCGFSLHRTWEWLSGSFEDGVGRCLDAS